MVKTLFTIVAIVAIATSKPRDLADEAQEQLDQLQSIVLGEITAAHNKLQELLTDFKVNEVDVAESGTVDLEQERQSVLGQLQTIKDLAHSAGKDVSSCTENRELVLNGLPEDYTNQMNGCIAGVDAEAVTAELSARYTVDVYINKVHDLQGQLRRCGDAQACISAILTEIELDKIRLPQNIGTEVQATESLLTTMKLSVKSCADDKVAQYNTEAFGILADIESCVNKIIG